MVASPASKGVNVWQQTVKSMQSDYNNWGKAEYKFAYSGYHYSKSDLKIEVRLECKGKSNM